MSKSSHGPNCYSRKIVREKYATNFFRLLRIAYGRFKSVKQLQANPTIVSSCLGYSYSVIQRNGAKKFRRLKGTNQNTRQQKCYTKLTLYMVKKLI